MNLKLGKLVTYQPTEFEKKCLHKDKVQMYAKNILLS